MEDGNVFGIRGSESRKEDNSQDWDSNQHEEAVTL